MRRASALLFAILTAGCGARTGPHVDELVDAADANGDTALEDTALDATNDATDDAADGADDALADAPLSDTGCSSDLDCDDGVACTEDRCDLALGRCRHAPVDVRCDDGKFCTVERCDVVKGCVTTARSCADAIDCTHDACDEATKSCAHAPDDALCPISHVCDPTLGCQARAIAHSETDLYEIRLPSGLVKKIGPTTGSLTDIALHPSGTFYGIDYAGVCPIDVKTGACSSPRVPLTGYMVGLDAAPDGLLYGAGDTKVVTINPTTGATTPVATLPSGLAASGDVAFVGPRMLVTARGGASDLLVEIDRATGGGKILGNVGFNCIWGLAGYGPTLYGLTCEGRVLRIDPVTGKGTQVSKTDVAFWGATAR